MIICLLSLLLLLLVCDDRILNFTLLRFIASIIRESESARVSKLIFIFSFLSIFCFNSRFLLFLVLFSFSFFEFSKQKKIEKEKWNFNSFQVFRIIGNSFYLFFLQQQVSFLVFSFPKLVIFHIIKVISIRFVDIIVRQRKIQYILEWDMER